MAKSNIQIKPGEPRPPIQEPTNGFTGRFNTIMIDFAVMTIEPWRLNFFFRFLLAELDRQKMPIDDAHMFLDFVGEKLRMAQGRLRPAIPAMLKKYKAQLRLSREEQEKGYASVEAHEQLAAASKEAEQKLEDTKE